MNFLKKRVNVDTTKYGEELYGYNLHFVCTCIHTFLLAYVIRAWSGTMFISYLDTQYPV